LLTGTILEIHNSTFVPEKEVKDLEADEKAYKDICGEDDPRINSYGEKQGVWVSSEYYAMRTQLPGRCYHVCYSDGSYRAS